MNDTSLLPDDFLADARERRTNIAALLLFAIVLGGVAFWYTRTNVAWHEIRDRQEQVRQSFTSVAEQIRDMQEQETMRRDMVDKAQLALSLVDPVPRSILLAELVDRLPERVSLVDLELRSQQIKQPAPRDRAPSGDARSKAARGRGDAPPEPARPDPVRYAIDGTLTGIAPNDLDVSAYLQRLNDLDLLESVRLEVSEEKTIAGVPSRQFRIAIRIGPEADVRRSRSILQADSDKTDTRRDEPPMAPPARVFADHEEGL
ncbi:MAG: PilN domain-containing protein [Planctomycetota bacterium]|nr:PilN domain-containing protein [Planctomycetota bacterium]